MNFKTKLYKKIAKKYSGSIGELFSEYDLSGTIFLQHIWIWALLDQIDSEIIVWRIKFEK